MRRLYDPDVRHVGVCENVGRWRLVMCGMHLLSHRVSALQCSIWAHIQTYMYRYVYPDTTEGIFRIEYSAKHRNMHCPYLHVNSAVEVPPGGYDVLHVTGIHPCRILMQASVKIAAVFVHCWSFLRIKERLPCSFYLSHLGFILSEKLDSLGHIRLTLL